MLIVLVPLSSHTSARKPVGKHFDRKPTQQGSRHLESPPTGNLERYDNRRNVITNHQSGTTIGSDVSIMALFGVRVSAVATRE